MKVLCKVDCYESNTCREFWAGNEYDLDPKFIKEHSMEKYFELPVVEKKIEKAVAKKVKGDEPKTEEAAVEEKASEPIKEEVKGDEPKTEEATE